MKLTPIAGLDRMAAVYLPPLRAVDRVAPGEWWFVYAQWALVVHSPVFVVDGVLRLDGVIKVGNV